MIELTLTQALALYSGALGLLALGVWVYTELAVRRPQRALGQQFLWRCVFCGCTYLDEQSRRLSPCPRCGSLNTRDEAAAAPGPDEAESPQEPDLAEAARNTSRRKRHHQRRRGPRRRGR